ncbi:MAG: EF-hand domain-containing protein [Pirellulales bacterium]
MIRIHPIKVSLLLLCALTMITACKKQTANPAAPATSTTSSEASNVATLATPEKEAEQAVSVEKPDTKMPAIVNSPQPEATTSDDPIQPPEPTWPQWLAEWKTEWAAKEETQKIATWRRVLLLLEGGPIILDFRISIDGKSLESATESIQQSLWPMLGLEENKELEWKTILEREDIRGGRFANIKPENEEQIHRLIQLYDRDRDEKVSPRELHAFLTRGLSEKISFQVEEASRFRGENRDRSAVFLKLDSNRNGTVEKEELREASKRLMAMDSNADFILNADEVRALELNADQYRRQKQVYAEDMALVWNASNSKEAARALLKRVGGTAIDAEQWFRATRVVECLDANRDQRLQRDELASLSNVSPDAIIAINLNSKSNSSQVLAYRLPPSETTTPSKKLEISNLRIDSQILDRLSEGEQQQRVNQWSQIWGVSPQESKEIESISTPIPNLPSPASLDQNHDGKLSHEEIVDCVSSRSALTSAIIRVRLIDVPDAWFAWLDSDWNGLISENEIQQTEHRMNPLMTDRDSVLAPESLPVQLEMVVARQFADEDSFRPEPRGEYERPSIEASVPDWFTSMDTNRDGVVSPREFLGDKNEFRKLDLNHNSLLDSQDFLKTP